MVVVVAVVVDVDVVVVVTVVVKPMDESTPVAGAVVVGTLTVVTVGRKKTETSGRVSKQRKCGPRVDKAR